MTFTKMELDLFEHTQASWWIPVDAYATGSGGANYIPDTYFFQDTSGYNLSAQLPGGSWIYRMSAAAAADRERRIGDNSGTFLDVSNGRIYHSGANYTNNVSNADHYAIHTIQPRITFDILLNTMRRLMMPFYGPLEKFTNAGCQSTTGWSISGAGSVAVNTTAGNVQTGATSLFFNAGTTGEYLKGATFKVTPGASYFVSANYRVDAGGPVYLVLWDETNNVEIENSGRVSHSYEQFVVMQRTFTVPSTCEEASVRIYVTAATDDVYLDYVNGAWKGTDRVIDLPSWAYRAKAIRKVMAARYTQSSGSGFEASSRVYDTPLKLRSEYGIRIDHNSANPYKLELSPNIELGNYEHWIEGVRRASDATAWAFTAAGESDPTCALPIEIVGYNWLADVCEYAISLDADDNQAQSTLNKLLGERIPGGGRAGGELTELMQDYENDLQTVPALPESAAWFLGGF